MDEQLPSYLEEWTASDRVHVLVQFGSLPGAAERDVLADELGIRFLDLVPETAFVVALPPDLQIARTLLAEERLGVRWVGVLLPEDRVAPWIVSRGVPEHARHEDGRVELLVEFFGDVNAILQHQILEDHGAEVLDSIGPINGWRVIVNEGAIRDLARRDPVKWIVEWFPPPEVDNDGVRSGTGVNSDAVAGGTPYDLTGNGVTVALWDGRQVSASHTDFGQRVTVGDAILPLSRTNAHDESVGANGHFDPGEGIYRDNDDNGRVSKDDFRITTAAGYAANTPVRATHSDVGTSLVHFLANDTSANPPVPGELFVDNDPDPNQRFAYTLGEPIYLDNDLSGSVSPGDTPLTPLTLGVVGDALIRFPTNPHWHPTMVAGTILGNGAMGGSPFQWRGVAPEALLRSYDVFPPAGMEHNDAIVNGAIVSTNPWGPVNSHCHQVEPPETCYDTYSQFYDVVVSGQTGEIRYRGVHLRRCGRRRHLFPG
jgi:hypothetical protein